MIICNECNNYLDDFDFGRSVCICLIYIQIVAGSWVERSFFHQHHQQLLPLFLKLNRLPEGGWSCLGPCLSRWYWTLECAAATGKWSLFSVSKPFSSSSLHYGNDEHSPWVDSLCSVHHSSLSEVSSPWPERSCFANSRDQGRKPRLLQDKRRHISLLVDCWCLVLATIDLVALVTSPVLKAKMKSQRLSTRLHLRRDEVAAWQATLRWLGRANEYLSLSFA